MSDTPTNRAPMSSDRWQQVQDVFAAAVECDTSARAQLLGDRCGDDQDLRREVESLLAAHDRPGLIDQLAPVIAPAAAWARTHISGWEGRRVGQYSVGELVDAGGMGVVHKAHDTRLGRDVALKFLPPHLSMEAAPKQRFLVEARAAAALDHPNICTIFEIGETTEGQLFLAMPLYDGETVAARLTRGRLRFQEALPVAVQIARGLGCAHARGIVHRDIKPSNVMLLRDSTVKILDFGIATIDEVSTAPVDARFGTLAYMSPEHLRDGAIDIRSDIWSLGVLLHEMLTGVRPFTGPDGSSTARAILNHEPELVTTSHPDVPADIDSVLRRALAKLPDDRYPSMAAFGADLMALQPGSGRTLARRGEAQEAVPISERRRAAVLVTVVSQYGSLVERMSPADAQRLVTQIRDAAVDAVRRYGGVVNQAIGEEIVSVFGVPAAHDDDELRAVRAALETHAQVRDTASTWGVANVQIQSGLHAGSVVAQRLNEGPRRYALVGAPASVASRLAAVAAPGELLASPECQRLLSPFVYTTAAPPVVIDAGGPAVTPFRVTGATGLETRLEASERAGLTPYVGRDADLASLDRYVDRARRSDGRVVEIVGDAGVGKSRLLHEFRQRILGTDVTIVQGRCRASGDVAPYSPFIEIIRAALQIRSRGESAARDVAARVRAVDEELESFLPLYVHLLSVPGDACPLPRHLQGEHLHAALVDSLAALFTAMSRRAPLVLLLEDWHWADAASRAVLARMRMIAPMERIVVVVTTRPDPVVFEQWPAHGARLPLEPLDFQSSAALI